MPDPYRKLTAAVVEIGTQLRRLADANATPVAADARSTTPDNRRRITYSFTISPELAEQRAETMNLLERYIGGQLCPTPETHNWGCGCPTDTGELRMELNAQRQRANQAEELLRVAHETSNRSEAERVNAVRRAELADAVTAETKRLMEHRTTTLRTRAERAEERRDQLAATLDEVLRHFTRKGHPGAPCLESGWVREDTVAKWRAVLYPPAIEEQP